MISCGAYARQHRRQESGGITTADRHHIYMHAETGLVSRVFDKARELLTDTIAMYRKRSACPSTWWWRRRGWEWFRAVGLLRGPRHAKCRGNYPLNCRDGL